jgi:exodeoxyribonuclease VII large subunit
MAEADAPPERDFDGEDVVTVAQLNGDIAALVDGATDLQHDYVVGDVSDCSAASGHVHFDLVYDDASIHCVLFGFRRNGTRTEPEEGTQVAVRGDLSYYEPHGSCSLLVTDVVEMGESAYGRVYEENRRTLKADGLLADDRKQELPGLPSTVGLVTSADSAARTDTVTAVHDRYPDVEVLLHDTTVQGEEALQELMSAVATLDDDPRIDVIVVTRGGGADRTLRVFDELPLCRVIAGTDTPTVVGVGHEDDRTLAGAVADHRVMTPTHAGDVVPVREDLAAEIDRLERDLDSAHARAVDTRLTELSAGLDNSYRTTATGLLQEIEADLDRAHDELRRRREHDEELAAATEAVRAQTRADLAATRRRYRIALGALVVLVIVLGALLII